MRSNPADVIHPLAVQLDFDRLDLIEQVQGSGGGHRIGLALPADLVGPYDSGFSQTKFQDSGQQIGQHADQDMTLDTRGGVVPDGAEHEKVFHVIKGVFDTLKVFIDLHFSFYILVYRLE